MKGGYLIKEARRRAGLSQRDLAARLETSQSVIARWESGARSPTMETVTRALRACGFELRIGVAQADDQDEAMAAQNVRLAARERLGLLENMFDVEEWASAARVVSDHAD